MFKILENIFQKKTHKIKNIEDKISKFYLSNIGVDINNPNKNQGILEEGTHASLMAKHGAYRKLYDAQFYEENTESFLN